MMDKLQNVLSNTETPHFQHWVKLLGWGFAVGVLVGVLTLYLQPTFLLTLATQVWACF